mgnify:CR=1 FL=1
MAEILKVVGTEVTINSATGNTVGLASMVRIAVTGTSHVLLTVSNGSVNSTMTLLANSVNYVKKLPTDLLFANVAAGVNGANCKVFNA